MGSTRALLLAGVMALGTATAALAADLPPPPPPPVYVPPPPEPVAYGGWYLRGDAGVGFAFNPDIRSTFYDATGVVSAADLATVVPGFGRGKESIGDVGFVDIGVGYQFNNWFRMDVTGEVRSEASIYADEFYDAGFFPPYNVPGKYYAHDIYTGGVQSSVFLVNGYADLGTWWGMTPFLGAGVGAVYHRLGNLVDVNNGVDIIAADGTQYTGVGAGGSGFARSTAKWNLAFAGMAGVSYALTQNLKLELGYRYLNMGSITSNKFECSGAGSICERQRYHLASNDIRIGLRWLINDTPPVFIPPPEAPIIRKY